MPQHPSPIWTDQAQALLKRLRRALAPWRGQRLILAVSGGCDSVALLRSSAALAPSLNLSLIVAHLHHGTRGADADADARFVQDLAAQLDLPFELGHWKPTRATGFEAEARNARYAWLTEVAHQQAATAVATAHTTDDQAETILFRILRGAGPRGLAGIPTRRPLSEQVTLLRPFLAASIDRQQLQGFLDHLGQPWREDATNHDLAHTRARIRHDLLPHLEASYNPRVRQALLRLGSLTHQLSLSLKHTLDQAEAACLIQFDSHHMVLDRQALEALPLITRAELLRRLWTRAEWPEHAMSHRRWQRLARAVRGKADCRLDIGQGVQLVATPAQFVLSRPPRLTALTTEPPVSLPVPGTAQWGRFLVTAGFDQPVLNGSSHSETLDLASLALPLFIRAAAPADRFDPLGLDGHTRPLADLFRSRKIPRQDRVGVPLVCDQRGIVWVVGHRIAHRARVTPVSTGILTLRWESHLPGGDAACD